MVAIFTGLQNYEATHFLLPVYRLAIRLKIRYSEKGVNKPLLTNGETKEQDFPMGSRIMGKNPLPAFCLPFMVGIKFNPSNLYDVYSGHPGTCPHRLRFS